MNSDKKGYLNFNIILAWAVHIFTSLGIVCGLLALYNISLQNLRLAAIWMISSLVIDSVDGSIARWVKVKEILPQINGEKIDFVIDFATYGLIPAFFILSTDVVLLEMKFLISGLMVLVSALYYGKEGMIGEDFTFIGFPVLWNIVVLFMYFTFDFSQVTNTILLLLFAVLHFVPLRYAYPSRASRIKVLSLTFFVLLLFVMTYSVYIFPLKTIGAKVIATISIIYFGLVALYETYQNKIIKKTQSIK